jgi:hypothetical protein
MSARLFVVCLIWIWTWSCPTFAWADDTTKQDGAAQSELNDLSLEVTALQMLHQFQFTPAQLERIRACAKECAETGRQREAGQASKEFRDKLRELHKALLFSNDADLIDQLSDELDDLRNEEKPGLEDDVKITKESRKHAPTILRLLKANQYAAYSALLVDLIDPMDLLTESIDKVREIDRAEWRAQRKKIAAEIGRLVGGVDAAKEEEMKKAVSALLTRARKLSPREFEQQRADLDKTVREIIGPISPADILRNEIEYSIAELLSNVRLTAALAARLQL